MKREMCRGDTILISIDATVEYPVTTLQEAYVSIKQGENEKLIPLSEFQLVTIPETGNQEYQYVISQEMSLGFEETRKHGYKVEISLVWLNQSGTRRQDPYKTVYEVNPTIYDDVMSGDSPIEPPDDYSGAIEVTPSTETQVLPTKNKIVLDDITIYPAPTESLATNENGTFLPSSGNVGFSEVVVDVEPSLESLSVTENGLYLPSGTDGFDRVTVSVPAPEPVLQGKAVNPSETAQHVEPDSGYDGLSAVDVGAIPSSYVGSGVTRRSSSDLSASGNTVNVPSGYYAESRSKSVQSGTAGTPTASKGAVSNHSIAVTPSVSNSEGYISGGTLTGNAITVSASELVSGTKQVSITANGTTTEDVTNYADAQITVNVVNQDYEDALVALGVTEDLTDSIGALTTYANGVTGESDTTLSDAVASLVDGYGGGGAGGLKYTRYDITSGDITIKTLLDTIDYAPVDPSNFTLFIRSSGAVAPTSGSYTHNNFFVRTTDVGALRGGYTYRNGKVTPNSFNDLYFGLTEVNNNFAITDGILRYTGSTTSCLGTTGDTIVIAELYGTSHISIEKMAGTGLTSIDNI